MGVKTSSETLGKHGDGKRIYHYLTVARAETRDWKIHNLILCIRIQKAVGVTLR